MNNINVSILSADSELLQIISSIPEVEKKIVLTEKYTRCNDILFKNQNQPDIFFVDDTLINPSDLFNFLNVFPAYYSGTKTIVYTDNLDGAFLSTLFSYDVNGIINKMESPAFTSKSKFIETIKLIYSGSFCLDNVVKSVLFRFAWLKGSANFRTEYELPHILSNDRMINANKSLGLLTCREKEILILIAEGNQNKKISEILHIDVGTVEQHKNKIIKKLDIISSNELTRFSLIYKAQISGRLIKI